MPLPPRVRLDPDVFRLPVERMREGYYSDAYFVYTKQLLEEDGHHPRVLMQVFQKQQSLLGGIDEAIAVLKLCAGRHGAGRRWATGWEQLEVRALYEGDAIAPLETVMTIEGDYALFAHLETVYLGLLARRSLIMRNVDAVVGQPAASRSSTSPRATTTGSCRPATAGPRTLPARSASRPTPRRSGGVGAAWAPSRTR